MEIPSVIIKKATGVHLLLSGDIYKSMVIELVYVQGFEPSATAINFISFLNARSNKPGVTVVKGRLPHQESYFTNQEIGYRRCQQNKVQYCEPNSSMGSFIDGHPLQTQEQLCFRDSL
jgi:hypothetical protein